MKSPIWLIVLLMLVPIGLGTATGCQSSNRNGFDTSAPDSTSPLQESTNTTPLRKEAPRGEVVVDEVEPLRDHEQSPLQAMAEKAYPFDAPGVTLVTVPLARRDPEAFPLFAQDDSTWCQLHFNRVTLQLSEEAVEHYANRDQAIDAMTVLASHWVEEVIDLITHYYPFDSEPSASVWQHAMSTTAEKFRLQNAPANAELLAIWNANPERPKATSLYLHYFEECFTIF